MRFDHLANPTVRTQPLPLLAILWIYLPAGAGCYTDANLDATLEQAEQYEDAGVGLNEESLTTREVLCKDPVFSKQIKVHERVVPSTLIETEGAYDIRQYCMEQINVRRTKSHSSYAIAGEHLWILPYHNALTDNVLPSYTLATVAKDGLNKGLEYCRAVADAEKGTHSKVELPLPGAGGAFCPITDHIENVKDAINQCLNMYEREQGNRGNHKGGLLFETTRPVSCILGVVKTDKGLKRGISVWWGKTNPDRNLPNGARCRAGNNCASGYCNMTEGAKPDFRCKGPAGSNCRTTPVLDCVKHPEDKTLCLARGFECQSGGCLANGKCK